MGQGIAENKRSKGHPFFGKHLARVLQALLSIWQVFGKRLASIWQEFGKCLASFSNHLASIWQEFGKHEAKQRARRVNKYALLASIWQAFGKYLASVWRALTSMGKHLASICLAFGKKWQVNGRSWCHWQNQQFQADLTIKFLLRY